MPSYFMWEQNYSFEENNIQLDNLMQFSFVWMHNVNRDILLGHLMFEIDMWNKTWALYFLLNLHMLVSYSQYHKTDFTWLIRD